MQVDNTTPLNSDEYDNSINNTIPFYNEFFEQTLDVIEQCGFSKLEWLDLGCGTGSLEKIALERFNELQFVMVDPSPQMLEKAQKKLEYDGIKYICCGSDSIEFDACFNVVTAIQAHHYMHESQRLKATENVYRALKKGGIYINFENVISEDDEVKSMELKRWGRYQIRHGKTEAEAKEHNARCGVNYFPISVAKHIELLMNVGFEHVHVFWYSYMQMGIYAIK